MAARPMIATAPAPSRAIPPTGPIRPTENAAASTTFSSRRSPDPPALSLFSIGAAVTAGCLKSLVGTCAWQDTPGLVGGQLGIALAGEPYSSVLGWVRSTARQNGAVVPDNGAFGLEQWRHGGGPVLTGRGMSERALSCLVLSSVPFGVHCSYPSCPGSRPVRRGLPISYWSSWSARRRRPAAWWRWRGAQPYPHRRR